MRRPESTSDRNSPGNRRRRQGGRDDVLDDERMRWRDLRASTNVEDRRTSARNAGSTRQRPRAGAEAGNGGGGAPGGAAVAILLLIGLGAYLAGVGTYPAVSALHAWLADSLAILDPGSILESAQMLQEQMDGAARHGPPSRHDGDPDTPRRPHDTHGRRASPSGGTAHDQMFDFVSRILGEAEDVWTAELPRQTGVHYSAPVLVMFSGSTYSACGNAVASMGPFYCPRDRKVYLDTAFFTDMQRSLGGGGNLAYAYVIAHEVAHHVENLLGILDQLDTSPWAGRRRRNAASVKVELMADCLAGVWTNRMEHRHRNLQEEDIRQAIATASAIGDDRLQ